MFRSIRTPVKNMTFDSFPQRVIVLRALQLGDMLCAVPAVRLLRSLLPFAEITLLSLPWAESFARRFCHYIDKFLEFPGYPGLPERAPLLREFPEFISHVQRQSFDLAIQLHGNGTITNPLIGLFNARVTAGFFRAGDYCPDQGRFLQYPEQESEIRRLLRLIEHLGGLSQNGRNEALEFPLIQQDAQALADIDEARRLVPGTYVCIHPGARAPERRWAADKFAAVADILAGQGFTIVLTGSDEERSLVSRVAGGMRAPCINLAGRTGVGCLAALLNNARLLICNDTGVMHLAAAVRTASINIFTGSHSDPVRWAPHDQNKHRIVCAGVNGVSVQRIIAEAEDLLLKEPAHAA